MKLTTLYVGPHHVKKQSILEQVLKANPGIEEIIFLKDVVGQSKKRLDVLKKLFKVLRSNKKIYNVVLPEKLGADNEAVIKLLAKFIKSMPRFKALSLRADDVMKIFSGDSIVVNTRAAESLGKALKRKRQLEMLCMQRCLQVGSAIPLVTLSPLSRLRSLRLSSIPMSINEMKILAEFLPRLSELRDLNLAEVQNRLGDVKDIEVLIGSLGGVENLESLNFANNRPIRREGVELLATALGSLKKLMYLNLSRVLENGDIQVLARDLRKLEKLKALDLSHNPLNKEDVEHLGAVLRDFKTLTSLKLAKIMNYCDGIKSLGEFLVNCDSLRYCDLSDNRILDDRCEVFSKILFRLNNPQLTLVWMNSYFSQGNLRATLQNRKDAFSLAELNLEGNSIGVGKGCLSSIAADILQERLLQERMLGSIQPKQIRLGIKRLNLKDNNIDDRELIPFATILPFIADLEELHLPCNSGIGYEGQMAVIKALNNPQTALKKVTLPGWLSPGLLKGLLEAFKNNTNLLSVEMKRDENAFQNSPTYRSNIEKLGYYLAHNNRLTHSKACVEEPAQLEQSTTVGALKQQPVPLKTQPKIKPIHRFFRGSKTKTLPPFVKEEGPAKRCMSMF